MAAAWGRAKRALATSLCISVPARQIAIEDSPPEAGVAEASSSLVQEKAESTSVSLRRLTSFGSRSSQVGESFFVFLSSSCLIHHSCRASNGVWRCGEMTVLAMDWVRFFPGKFVVFISRQKDADFASMLVNDSR